MLIPLKTCSISFGFKMFHAGSFRSYVGEIPRKPHQTESCQIQASFEGS